MLHDEHSDDNDGLVLKPRPRPPFELSSPPPSAPSTPPAGEHKFPTYLQAPNSSMDGTSTPSRTRSFLNLTSSTLFGIYQPTGYGEREEATTPWGTGAQTPAMSRTASLDGSRSALSDSMLQRNGSTVVEERGRSRSQRQKIHHKPRKGFKGLWLPATGRLVALAAVGVLYGLLITHLHDRQQLAPIKVEVDRSSWSYLALWGLAGVVFGEALPWVDTLWAPEDSNEEAPAVNQEKKVTRGLDGWMDIVRSIGAFVGIAFAIRKLPWQSSLQLSLTLALANPAVWYLIDRSAPGFILASIAALTGTAVLIGINPTLVPSPSPAEVLRGHVARHGGANGSANAVDSDSLVLGFFNQESVGIATWIASVLFVSSVCFGNIGRRLAPQKP